MFEGKRINRLACNVPAHLSRFAEARTSPSRRYLKLLLDMSFSEEWRGFWIGEDALSEVVLDVAVVKAGRRPPVGLGLDDGAARTAATSQWTRTPGRGS